MKSSECALKLQEALDTMKKQDFNKVRRELYDEGFEFLRSDMLGSASLWGDFVAKQEIELIKKVLSMLKLEKEPWSKKRMDKIFEGIYSSDVLEQLSVKEAEEKRKFIFYAFITFSNLGEGFLDLARPFIEKGYGPVSFRQEQYYFGLHEIIQNPNIYESWLDYAVNRASCGNEIKLVRKLNICCLDGFYKVSPKNCLKEVAEFALDKSLDDLHTPTELYHRIINVTEYHFEQGYKIAQIQDCYNLGVNSVIAYSTRAN